MCERFEGEVPFYVASAVAPRQSARIERHLERCGTCRAVAVEWSAIGAGARAAALPWVLPVPPLAPLLESARGSRRAVRSDWSPGAHVARSDDWRARARTWLALLLAVLLIAFVLLLAADRLAPQVPGNSSAPAPGAAPVGVPVGDALGRRQEPTGQPSPGAGTMAAPGLPAEARLPDGLPSSVRAPGGGTDAGVTGRLPADAAAPIMVPTPVSGTLQAATASTASILGRITGPDGRARAEIQVIASNDDDQAGPVRAFSDASGMYALAVPPGRWRLHIEAPAYQLQWYQHASTPFGARAIDLAAGEVRSGADFALVPYPRAHIAGRVTSAGGRPVSRALVVAVPVDRAAGRAEAPPVGVAGYTDDEGAYTLFVDPGAYYVGAAPDSSSTLLMWWPAGISIAEGRVLDLVADGASAVADFELLPGPRR